MSSFRIGVFAVASTAFLMMFGFLVLRGKQAPDVRREDLRVVTTTPVIYSLTAKVLGDHGSITNLVPPGASPENYALRPRDASALARADVLVINGLGFEAFLEDEIREARQRGVRVVTASDGVPFTGNPPDPHVWVDPVRAASMVRTIAQDLAAFDPARAETYRDNAVTAVRSLLNLDEEFRAQLTPLTEKRFIAFHPAWGYFAERYGLEQAAVVEEIPGREPTAQELAALITLVRRTGVRALMSEPQFSSKIVEALKRDLGLTVHEVNPEGGELSASGYENFMRANVATFVRALNGT